VHIVTAPLRAVQAYDTIFFAPVDDLGNSYVDLILKTLVSVYKKTYTQKDLKEILQELRVAKAGLSWTKVGETEGSLYWYDPEIVTGESLTKKQLSELFQFLSVQFT
jgi:hypothetical protein